MAYATTGSDDLNTIISLEGCFVKMPCICFGSLTSAVDIAQEEVLTQAYRRSQFEAAPQTLEAQTGARRKI